MILRMTLMAISFLFYAVFVSAQHAGHADHSDHTGHNNHVAPPNPPPSEENAEEQIYHLVIDYLKSPQSLAHPSDDSRPIGLYLLDSNGQPLSEPRFPGPTLTFEEGSMAVIKVTNLLDEETSIHWHGLILPNDQDGVPHITSKAIPPRSRDFEYRFMIRQAGTYWYHSHSGLQEQRGLYGPFIILPSQDPMDSGQAHEHFDIERVLDFSDYVRRDPMDIITNLKTDSEKESRIKGTERTLAKDIRDGTVKQRWLCEASGMGPMDIADVALDGLFVNGELESSIPTSANRSQKVKLRLINSSASSMLRIQYGQGRSFRIVASDGLDVTGYNTTSLAMGVGETYDVIVDTDPNHQIEFRASIFDTVTMWRALTWIGPKNKPKEGAPIVTDLNPYAHAMADTPYEQIRTLRPLDEKYKWQDNAPITEFKMTLTGNMYNGYNWSMNNNKVFGDTKPYHIKRGDHVKITLENSTMMFHPIHLHGHFFSLQLLDVQHETCGGETAPSHDGGPVGGGGGGHGNHTATTTLLADDGGHGGHGNHGGGHNSGGGHGNHPTPNPPTDGSPRLWKHTFVMAPHSKYLLEFNASESKNWLFHCHNLYHMVSGMTVLFAYTDDVGSSNLDPQKLIDHDKEMSGKNGGYYNYDLNIWSNHGEGQFNINVDDQWNLKFSGKYNPTDGENRERGEVIYYPLQTSNVGVYGAVENSTQAEGVFGAAGLKFKAPFMIDAQLGYGSKGIDACVSKDLPLIGNLYAFGDWCKQGKAQYYNVGVGYRVTPNEKQMGVSTACGLNEDGPYCGVKIQGNGHAPSEASKMFDHLIPKN